jgi:hypothetical protein
MPDTEHKIRVALAMAMTHPCLLCRGRPNGVALFQPSDPSAWGAAAGKTRLLFYSLCDGCRDRPDCLEAAEEVFRNDGRLRAGTQ